MYDPQRHRPQVLGTWQDSGMTCLSFAAWVLWLQGYPDQARERSHHALTLSEALSHPYTKAFAVRSAAMLYRFLQERQQAQEHTETAMTLATDHGFAEFLAERTIMQGWTLVTQGHAAEGMAQLREGLDAYRAKGIELNLPYSLALLAEAYWTQGQVEEGLTVLAEALALVDKNAERWWEEELHRLKGELLLQQAVPDAPQAEICFQQALAIARRQQAKSLELRAAMSLARLWQRQDKRVEAYQLLADVYGWFTEGFDTADLQEAKVLLKELEGERQKVGITWKTP